METFNLDPEEVIQKHAYMIADQNAKTIDGYVQLYIRKRPKWLPEIVYKYILKQVLVLAFFKKHEY